MARQVGLHSSRTKSSGAVFEPTLMPQGWKYQAYKKAFFEPQPRWFDQAPNDIAWHSRQVVIISSLPTSRLTLFDPVDLAREDVQGVSFSTGSSLDSIYPFPLL